jgi:hypothetical protein
MAITLKKKDLEQKTARTVPAEPQQAAGAGSQPAGLTPFGVEEKKPSYVVYGILGILAVLMFAGLLLIQWIEWSEYNRPGVFPVLRGEAFAEAASDAAAKGAETPVPDAPVSAAEKAAPAEETAPAEEAAPAEETPGDAVLEPEADDTGVTAADDSLFPE